MPKRTVLLLPPSEGKAAGGRGARWDPTVGVFGALADAREEVAAALADAATDPTWGAEHLGVGGVALAQALAEDRALRTAPTRAALDRYTGVLYDALGRVPAAGRRRTVIVSGLAGLLGGGDPVPAYKLPIGAALPGLGRLASWWRPRLSPALDAHVAGAVVWDLLPAAHAAAWRDGGAHVGRWRVTVVRADADGRRTTVSHDNKSTKGRLAAALLATGASSPGELAGWAAGQGLGVEVHDWQVTLVRSPATMATTMATGLPR